MNPRRVIVWMTAGVCLVIGYLMAAVFGGWPPWPVLACFALSHVFFCFVIARVRPYRGPHTEPMAERTSDEWK
jgi:membrane protein implicated in regulation of membrane protease activity